MQTRSSGAGDARCGPYTALRSSRLCAIWRHEPLVNATECGGEKTFAMHSIGYRMAGGWLFHGKKSPVFIDRETVIAGSPGPGLRLQARGGRMRLCVRRQLVTGRSGCRGSTNIRRRGYHRVAAPGPQAFVDDRRRRSIRLVRLRSVRLRVAGFASPERSLAARRLSDAAHEAFYRTPRLRRVNVDGHCGLSRNFAIHVHSPV